MFGGIGSGAYVAFSMRQREIEEEEEVVYIQWNSIQQSKE